MAEPPNRPVEPPDPERVPPLEEEEPVLGEAESVERAPPLAEEERVLGEAESVERAPPIADVEGDVTESAAEGFEERRENIRGLLAAVLVGILAVAIVGGLFFVANGNLKVTQLKGLSPLVITPLVTLVGTVLGFYFGGQTAKDQPTKSKRGR